MKPLNETSWLSSLIGFLIVIALIVPVSVFLLKDHFSPTAPMFVGDEAFGILASDPSPETSRAGGGLAIAESSLVPTDDFIPPMPSERYEYLYDGPLPDLASIDPTVYRPVSSLSAPDAINTAFSSFTIGGVSLSAFSSLSLSTFTLNEEDPLGYSIGFDQRAKGATLTRNDPYWETISYDKPVDLSLIPSDPEITATTDQFAQQYQLDLSGYSTPYVDRSFLRQDWLPESLTVYYPLLVAGKEVWGTFGLPSGLSLSVSLRTGEVDHGWIPTPADLEASTYTLVTDPEIILDIASRGGLWEPDTTDAEIVYQARLGEPTVVLAEHYSYSSDSETTILYVPALMFPVVESDAEAPYQRQSVVVPIVQSILDELGERNPPPIPEPEPLPLN